MASRRLRPFSPTPPQSSAGPYLRDRRRTPERSGRACHVPFDSAASRPKQLSRRHAHAQPQTRSTRTHIGAIRLASRQPTVRNANGSDAGELELLEAGRRESRLVQSKHPLASTHGRLFPSSLPVYLLIAPSHSSFPSIPNSFVTSISLSSSVPELFRGSPIKTTRLLYMTLINSHKFLASPPNYKTPRDICGPVARTREPGTRMTTLCK